MIGKLLKLVLIIAATAMVILVVFAVFPDVKEKGEAIGEGAVEFVNQQFGVDLKEEGEKLREEK